MTRRCNMKLLAVLSMALLGSSRASDSSAAEVLREQTSEFDDLASDGRELAALSPSPSPSFSPTPSDDPTLDSTLSPSNSTTTETATATAFSTVTTTYTLTSTTVTSSLTTLTRERPTTTLIEPVEARATVLNVESTEGFLVGMQVVISGGGNTETHTIASIGSIVLTQPLQHGYPAGSTVTGILAPPEPACEGSAYFNQSVRIGDNGDCSRAARRIVVDTSHCSFEVTPEYRISAGRLSVYDCSFVGNPTPAGFEMLCAFSPTFSTTMTTDTSTTATATDATASATITSTVTDTSFTTQGPARRLTGDLGPYYDDDDAVLKWTATPPAFLAECRDQIDNLTDRISELEGQINDLLDTETTSLTSTSVSTTTTDLTTTGTSSTSTTVVPAIASVLAAGIATDCNSLLPYMIASLAFNLILLLLLLLAYVVIRRRKPVLLPVEQANLVQQQDVHFDLDESSCPATAVAASEPAASAAPSQSNALSLGGSAQVEGVRSAGQPTSDCWAGRSVIYRYLRHSRTEGNDIEAVARLGWRMNVAEPPGLERSMTQSGTGLSGAGTRSLPGTRSVRKVTLAPEDGGAAGGATSAGVALAGSALSAGKAKEGSSSGDATTNASEPAAEADENHMV